MGPTIISLGIAAPRVPRKMPRFWRGGQGDVRALLVTLFAARGTPMLNMGDELGRSQSGNNNAYAQDNELAWINWAERRCFAYRFRCTTDPRAPVARRSQRGNAIDRRARSTPPGFPMSNG